MTVAFDIHSDALIAPRGENFDPDATVQHTPAYADLDAEYRYDPYAPFVWSGAARSDPNAHGRFGLRHATECSRGTVEPLIPAPARHVAHKSHRAASAAAKAAKMRSMENSKQAVCWALQARGVSPAQIEAEVDSVLDAAQENSENDFSGELEVGGKWQQATLLRRVLSSHERRPQTGHGSLLERTVTSLSNKSHGLRKRASRCPSAPPVRRKRHAAKPTVQELPFEQVRSLFRERMRSMMLQDSKAMRRLFNQFGTEHNGEILLSAPQFGQMAEQLDMNLSVEQTEQLITKMNDTRSSRLTFQDFLENLLALPHDFFSLNFESKSFQKVQEPLKARRPMPAGTSVEAAHYQLTRHLRKKLLNANRLRHAVFKAMPGKLHCTKIDLWDTFQRLQMVCKEAEFNEIFDHFNFRRNSKLHQMEFLCELLDLPYPDGFSPPPPQLLTNRKSLSVGTQKILERLKHAIEKLGVAGKTPAEHVRRLWKGYDVDGSGEISYDEIHKMTKEFDIGVDGQNSAADILAHLDPQGKGFINYQDFMKNLVNLDPAVFSKEPGANASSGEARPSTPELRAEVATKIKQKMISSTSAVQRAFSFIAKDKDPQEGCSLKEFIEAFNKLGFPVKRDQVKQLFDESGPDSQGKLSVSKLYEKITGEPMQSQEEPVLSKQQEQQVVEPRARPATAASNRSHQNWGRPATAVKPPYSREPPWGLDLDQLIKSSAAAPTDRQEKKVMGHVVHRPGTAMSRRPTAEPAVPRTVYAVPHPMKRTAKKRPGTVAGPRDKTTKLTGLGATWAAQTAVQLEGDHMGPKRSMSASGAFLCA